MKSLAKKKHLLWQLRKVPRHFVVYKNSGYSEDLHWKCICDPPKIFFYTTWLIFYQSLTGKIFEYYESCSQKISLMVVYSVILGSGDDVLLTLYIPNKVSYHSLYLFVCMFVLVGFVMLKRWYKSTNRIYTIIQIWLTLSWLKIYWF